MKKDTKSFSFRPSAEAPQSDVGNQKWRLGSKLGVYGEAAGKAKQQAASSLVTVYLLTGPMLLGIPAREEQREKHVTAAWRLCWLTSGLLFYWKLVESGHMAALWHPQMLLVGCMFSFTVRCCLGSERCKKHLRTSWEQKQCCGRDRWQRRALPNFRKLLWDAFELTCDACRQSHKEAIKGHRRWGTCLILLLSARPSIIQFPLPDSRRGDNKICLIPMVTRSPTPGHYWAVDLRRWRHSQDSCEHLSSIWAEMSSLVLGFFWV